MEHVPDVDVSFRFLKAIKWHPQYESMFASGGAEGALYYWSVDSPLPVGKLDSAHESNIWSMDFHPWGHILATAGNDNSTRFWTRNRPNESLDSMFTKVREITEDLNNWNAPGARPAYLRGGSRFGMMQRGAAGPSGGPPASGANATAMQQAGTTIAPGLQQQQQPGGTPTVPPASIPGFGGPAGAQQAGSDAGVIPGMRIPSMPMQPPRPPAPGFAAPPPLPGTAYRPPAPGGLRPPVPASLMPGTLPYRPPMPSLTPSAPMTAPPPPGIIRPGMPPAPGTVPRPPLTRVPMPPPPGSNNR